MIILQTTECSLTTPTETHHLTPKPKRKTQRATFRGISLESLSWKSFSKSILVESDDSQMQNELLIAELSKALEETSKNETKNKPERVETSQNHYFQIPFK